MVDRQARAVPKRPSAVLDAGGARDSSTGRPGRLARLRFADWPIALKLIVLSVGCPLLLAARLTFLAYTKASAGLTALAEAGLGSDAQLTADAIDRWNSHLLSNLTIEAQQPALRLLLQGGGATATATATASATATRNAQQTLSALALGSPNTDSIGLLNLSGDFVLSSNPMDLGTNVSQRDYFTQAAAGHSFISGVSISTITHAPVIFHSVPVVDASGDVLGVLRSRSSLDAASQAVRLADGRVGIGAAGVLLDQQGLVIASADPTWTLRPVVSLSSQTLGALLDDKRWGGSPAPEPLGQPDLATALMLLVPTVFEWTNADQVEHSIAIPLKETRWTYVLGVPVTTFSASVTDFLRSALFAALAGVLLISLLVSYTARQIASSVAQVTAAARRIATEDLPSLARVARALAEGDLTREAHITARRIEIHGRDEMGAMAQDFNAMIGGLQATGAAFKHTSANLRELVGQVQTSAARFEALVQNAADVILIQDTDGVITYASPATSRPIAALDLEAWVAESAPGWQSMAEASNTQTVMLHTEDVTEIRPTDRQREAMAQSEKLRGLGQMATGIAHDLNQSLMLVTRSGDLARQALVQHPPNLTELEDPAA
jgi:C4-dicarboxylate-specific signal transduction histidine kinase